MNGMTIDPTRIDLATDPTHQRFIGIARHGNTYFDVPFISHIEGDLWQGGTQTGLVLPERFDHVVSLYQAEKYTVHHDLITENYFLMYDSTRQSFEQVDEIARHVNECLEDGPTVVLCQAGLNRSSLVTARSLMLRGWTADEAITLIRTQRSPAALCNPSFEAWLRSL